MTHPDVFELMDEWGPEKIVVVSHRRTGMKGVLVLDNTARGIGKGGTRMSPTLTVAEVARLARTMTWKWAVVDLFYGGAKAGILGDPQHPEKEAVLRAFARALANEVPAEYVFGLDIGLAEHDAAIFVDELGTRGVATGLPRELGGVPYDKLGVTGYGVAQAAAAAVGRDNIDLAGLRVVVQGFGAVGSAAAKYLHDSGATVVAVSNALGTLHSPRGLDIPQLLTLRDVHGDGGLGTAGPLQPVSAALEVDCDMVIPAASQDTIDHEVAATTRARWIVEGANLPTTARGLDILHRRGVTVVPDFVANAGGIVAAAFSMDARTSGFAVDTAPVFDHVTRVIRANTVRVLDDSADTGRSPHEVAMLLAQQRVRTAMSLRGQLPTSTGSTVENITV